MTAPAMTHTNRRAPTIVTAPDAIIIIVVDRLHIERLVLKIRLVALGDQTHDVGVYGCEEHDADTVQAFPP